MEEEKIDFNVLPTQEIIEEEIIDFDVLELPTQEKIEETRKELLKNIRNQLLQEYDKYMLPDYPITPEKLEIVKQYRQALRNFTLNNYILPDKPDLIPCLSDNAAVRWIYRLPKVED